MVVPSVVRLAISQYFFTVVWAQRYSVQDFLSPNIQIGSAFYPPNSFTDLPIEIFEILTTTDKSYSDASYPRTSTVFMRVPIRMVYIFNRDLFPTFRDIPIRQLENLYINLALIINLFANDIHKDIVKIEIPRQNNPFLIRVADDINTDSSGSNSWAITMKLFMDVTFILSANEFVPQDFSQIQPSVFNNPDSVPPKDVLDQGQTLKGINLHVNRSKLGQLSQTDTSTYEEMVDLELRQTDANTPPPT